MGKNMMKPILPCLGVVLTALMLFTASASAGDAIKWHSYESGIKKANDEVRKIYINFHADWCYYCKQMEKITFKDPAVISYLNENFVAIRVDTEKEKKIARDYRVQGLPASWFLEADGSKIGMKPGFLRPKELLQNLKFVYDEKYKSKK
jgi:thioredoxin-related protein